MMKKKERIASLSKEQQEFLQIAQSDGETVDYSISKQGGLILKGIAINEQTHINIPDKTVFTEICIIRNCHTVVIGDDCRFLRGIDVNTVNTLCFGLRGLFLDIIRIERCCSVSLWPGNALFCRLFIRESVITDIDEYLCVGVSATIIESQAVKTPKIIKTMCDWIFDNSDSLDMPFDRKCMDMWFVINGKDAARMVNAIELTEKFFIVENYIWTPSEYMDRYTCLEILSTNKDGVIKAVNVITNERKYVFISGGIPFIGNTAIEAKKMASIMLQPGEREWIVKGDRRGLDIDKKLSMNSIVKLYQALSDATIVDVVLLVRNNRLLNRKTLSLRELLMLSDKNVHIKRLKKVLVDK